jgi:cardiolipin synthase
MKDLFKGCWTIPNLLSVIRILLIPVFAYLFYNDEKIWAVVVLALSGLSDTFDGQIARKFNQISALGKVLDPVADKLTQITIAVMLFIDFKTAANPIINALGWVFLVFLIKEAVMIIGGLIMLLLNIRPGAAEFWGKAATVVFYVGMVIIIAVGPEVGALNDILGFQLSNFITGAIVVLCAIMTLAAFASYMPETFRQFKEYFDNRKAAKNSK